MADDSVVAASRRPCDIPSEDGASRCDFETVYREFDAPLRRFVRSRVRDEAAAQDVLQEVYLRVHSRIHSLRDCGKLSSWLYRIARNSIVDHFHSRRPAEELSETWPAPGDPCEDDAICELAKGLSSMVDALPKKYAEALRLALDEGLTQEEIGLRLGLSHTGAKSRVQRARGMLRDMLLECCHFELDRFGRVIDYQERCCCCAPARAASAARRRSE